MQYLWSILYTRKGALEPFYRLEDFLQFIENFQERGYNVLTAHEISRGFYRKTYRHKSKD